MAFTKEYLNYLKSNEWAQLKIDLFDKRGHKCEQCGSKKKLQVHHLSYKNLFQEEPEDLIILCEKCHIKKHKKTITAKKKKIKQQVKPVIKDKAYWDRRRAEYNNKNCKIKGRYRRTMLISS